MTWAWRRVWQLVEHEGRGGDTDERLRDFVDRIEEIYAWSQFLVVREPRIPGGQAHHPLISSENYRFSGAEWHALRETRRSSTGLISPLNYGPGLRSMNWLLPAGPAGVFHANPDLNSALDAFEELLKAELNHDAFSRIGEVSVAYEDVRRWGALWTLSEPTQIEREASYERLAGEHAATARRDGFALVRAALEVTPHEDGYTTRVRAAMAATASDEWNGSAAVVGVGAVWRKLQVRQVFRLALEALLYWMVEALDGGPMASTPLARLFLSMTEQEKDEGDAESWFNRLTGFEDPVGHLEAIRDALRGIHDRRLEQTIVEALAFLHSRGARSGRVL
jgi:hypothetical protein